MGWGGPVRRYVASPSEKQSQGGWLWGWQGFRRQLRAGHPLQPPCRPRAQLHPYFLQLRLLGEPALLGGLGSRVRGARDARGGCPGAGGGGHLPPSLGAGAAEARVTLWLTFLGGHVAPTGRDSCAQGPDRLCSQGGARSPFRPCACSGLGGRRVPGVGGLSRESLEAWGHWGSLGGWGRTRRSSRSRRGSSCTNLTTRRRRCRCG